VWPCVVAGCLRPCVVAGCLSCLVSEASCLVSEASCLVSEATCLVGVASDTLVRMDEVTCWCGWMNSEGKTERGRYHMQHALGTQH